MAKRPSEESHDPKGSPDEKVQKLQTDVEKAAEKAVEDAVEKLAQEADAGKFGVKATPAQAAAAPAVPNPSSSSTAGAALPIVSQTALSLSLSPLPASTFSLPLPLTDSTLATPPAAPAVPTDGSLGSEAHGGRGVMSKFRFQQKSPAPNAGFTAVQSLLIEAKRANALSTQAVKNGREHAETTLSVMHQQQAQMAEMLKVFSTALNIPQREATPAGVKELFGDGPYNPGNLAALAAKNAMGDAQRLAPLAQGKGSSSSSTGGGPNPSNVPSTPLT